MALDTRCLGKNGPVISALGLGCMGMSEFYGHSEPHRKAALKAWEFIATFQPEAE